MRQLEQAHGQLVGAIRVADQIAASLENAEHAKNLGRRAIQTLRDDRLTLQVAEADRFVPALLGELPKLASNLVVNTLQIRKPTLEDVFLKLTGRLIREEDEGKKDERRLQLRKRRRI